MTCCVSYLMKVDNGTCCPVIGNQVEGTLERDRHHLPHSLRVADWPEHIFPGRPFMPAILCPSCGSTFFTSASLERPVMLQSWKEIACYMRLGIRTLREHDCGFPVHRINGNDHTSVFAVPHEIEEWLSRRPMRKSTAPQNGHGDRTAA